MGAAARIYGGLITALACAVGPLFLLHTRGRRRLKERFGVWNLDAPEVVWFHGASLGEMNGLVPLMRRWKSRFPDVPILATATSTTGLERAEGIAACTRLVPFDSGVFLKRALGSTPVRAFIFGETEVWPSLLSELEARGVPRFLVNARISADSLRAYQRFEALFSPPVKALTRVMAASPSDGERWIALGAPRERCCTRGNAKYDLAMPNLEPGARRAVREALTPRSAPVVVLGSIRPGEDDVWFPVLKELLDAELTVVVAPRHPEKFSYFADRLGSFAIPFRRWTTPETPPRSAGLDVVLLDTLGELQKIYTAADLAFVGGSLVDWGGHNPLEPALCGVCVACGPFMGSVEDVMAALDAVGGRVALSGADSIEALLTRVLERDPMLAEIGARGREAALQFTGAADAIFADIVSALGLHGGAHGA